MDASDDVMMKFAKQHLNYDHNKGLDFVARFNKTYVIGEAKFLSDFGGHQNAQFNDAIGTIHAKNVKAVKIAILDGVLYIKGRNKMYQSITETYKDYNINKLFGIKRLFIPIIRNEKYFDKWRKF